MKIEFVSIAEISLYEDIAEKFFRDVFGTSEYFITDESRLFDFVGFSDHPDFPDKLKKGIFANKEEKQRWFRWVDSKIKEVYGFSLYDLPVGNPYLSELFLEIRLRM